ncbi:MAG: glycosyl transferase, partial [Rhodobacter sp.]|nr:glycosyl transferase [Rhodobacter sp.]
MAAKDRGRGPLVADKRYSTSRAGPSGGGPRKPAPPKEPPRQPRRRAGAARPRRQHGVILGLILAIWRVIWGIAWRGSVIGGLILGGFVWYYFAQLPELEAVVDDRARGSVTMLDRTGEVFAWRGETFGGMVTAESVSPDLHDAVL